MSTVYLNTQKYGLFCSLRLNLLSHRHTNSFHMRVLACSHVTRRPCWRCVGGQYNTLFFRRIYMKMEFSSQRREMLFVLDYQHTTVTARANQQLLMWSTCKYQTFPYFDACTYSVPVMTCWTPVWCKRVQSIIYSRLSAVQGLKTHHLVSLRHTI